MYLGGGKYSINKTINRINIENNNMYTYDIQYYR